MNEALALGEAQDRRWADQSFWVAGFKNLGAFVALLAGDADRAMELIDESRRVLEPLDEFYYLTWNLGHRARVAAAEGRLNDAIELFSQSAGHARKIGFLRGLQFSMDSLGDTNLATGDLAAAEAAFIESLDAADRTRMVPEMLGALGKLGRVFVADGRHTKAVKLLATVIAEPASDRRLLAQSDSIKETASAELEKLQDAIDPEEYSAARASGSSKDYRVVAKELINTIS